MIKELAELINETGHCYSCLPIRSGLRGSMWGRGTGATRLRGSAPGVEAGGATRVLAY